MTTIEVLTPSYLPDFELCADLQRSVRRYGGPGVSHTILTPRRDLPRFAELDDSRTRVVDAATMLPRWLRPLPRNLWVSPRRPWWPVRGWITQQIVKLEATARSAADLVVVADSDLVFVRPFDHSSFVGSGGPSFYGLPDGVHAGLPRHVEWHRVARRLLGLPDDVQPPLVDYICWPCPWEPAVTRAMLEHITATHGRAWQHLVAGCRHFSEMILYGVYVDEVLGSRARVTRTSDMRCLQYSDDPALDDAGLRRLMGRISPTDLAVMINAKSGTPLDARRRALASVA